MPGEPRFDVIAFDADDTLWHNETQYTEAREKFVALLSECGGADAIERRLSDTEIANLVYYGYGIKSFALSMIEAAVDLTNGRIDGRGVRGVIEIIKDMLDAPVRLFDNVTETLSDLQGQYPLMLITKGDLFEQSRKVERSGLAGYFRHVEIVAHKTSEVYRALLQKYGIDPQRFVMIGNSLQSDILPVISVGGGAIYVPYEYTWFHEMSSDPPVGADGYYEVDHLGEVPALLRRLQRGETIETHHQKPQRPPT